MSGEEIGWIIFCRHAAQLYSLAITAWSAVRYGYYMFLLNLPFLRLLRPLSQIMTKKGIFFVTNASFIACRDGHRSCRLRTGRVVQVARRSRIESPGEFPSAVFLLSVD